MDTIILFQYICVLIQDILVDVKTVSYVFKIKYGVVFYVNSYLIGLKEKVS